MVLNEVTSAKLISVLLGQLLIFSVIVIVLHAFVIANNTIELKKTIQMF